MDMVVAGLLGEKLLSFIKFSQGIAIFVDPPSLRCILMYKLW